MSADEKCIWICPLCTITFRSLEAFTDHLQKNAATIQSALADPTKCAKTVRR